MFGESFAEFSPNGTIEIRPRSARFRDRNIKTLVLGMMFVLMLHNFIVSIKLYFKRNRKLPYLFCIAQSASILSAWFMTAGHSVFGSAWDCRVVLFADLMFISFALACISFVLLLKANSIRAVSAARKATDLLSTTSSLEQPTKYSLLRDSRWIWPVGLTLIAVPMILRIYAITFIESTNREDSCHLPVPNAIWSIATFVSDVLCNAFLTACFLWKIRDFLREGYPVGVMSLVYREGLLYALAIIVCNTTFSILALALPQSNILFHAIDVGITSTLLVRNLSFQVSPSNVRCR